jgi:hypothetical protein
MKINKYLVQILKAIGVPDPMALFYKSCKNVVASYIDMLPLR